MLNLYYILNGHLFLTISFRPSLFHIVYVNSKYKNDISLVWIWSLIRIYIRVVHEAQWFPPFCRILIICVVMLWCKTIQQRNIIYLLTYSIISLNTCWHNTTYHSLKEYRMSIGLLRLSKTLVNVLLRIKFRFFLR